MPARQTSLPARIRIPLVFCVGVVLAFVGSVNATAGPPNVVLIISDDQAWNDYGFMGHQVVQTPHLDALARQSALFPRGYVPSSLCRPSLMTMITGLYPHEHGITGNDPPRGTDRQEMLKHIKAATTLPELLAEQGYLSLQTGKWWEGSPRLAGFTHAMTHGDPQRGGRHGDLGLKIGREGLQPIADFLDACDGRPFFLWYAPFLPHSPHNPPARLLSKYRSPDRSIHVARYYAMCEWFDETCGQLLQMLDDRRLSDNTLVIYVADNGWIQSTNSRRYAPRSKRSPFDGGLRTPIMLRLPQTIEPARFEMPVSSIDLAPTILAACGMTPTADMSGLNLLDICIGNAKQRSTVYGEIFEHDVVDIDQPAASLQYRWVIEGHWKLILPHSGGDAALFNLADDPFEMRNLAAERSGLVGRLKQQTNAWWTVGQNGE